MRAVRLHAFTEMPRVDEVPEPDPPGEGELTIAVAAAGVGAWDLGVVDGRLERFAPADLPFVLGAEFAGRVTAVGEGVAGFTVGDRVMGNPGVAGAWAERVTVPASDCGRSPASLDDVFAAAAPVAALSAWQSLELLDLPRGAALLILGAGGGVGSAALQIARNRGLRVIGTGSGAELERIRALGADVAHDYRGDWVNGLRPAVGAGVDGVLALVNGETLSRSASLVRDGGRAVTTLHRSADTELPRGISVDYLRMKSDTATLDAIADLIDAGGLTIGVASRHAPEQVERALDEMRDGPSGAPVLVFAH